MEVSLYVDCIFFHFVFDRIFSSFCIFQPVSRQVARQIALPLKLRTCLRRGQRPDRADCCESHLGCVTPLSQTRPEKMEFRYHYQSVPRYSSIFVFILFSSPVLSSLSHFIPIFPPSLLILPSFASYLLVDRRVPDLPQELKGALLFRHRNLVPRSTKFHLTVVYVQRYRCRVFAFVCAYGASFPRLPYAHRL